VAVFVFSPKTLNLALGDPLSMGLNECALIWFQTQQQMAVPSNSLLSGFPVVMAMNCTSFKNLLGEKYITLGHDLCI